MMRRKSGRNICADVEGFSTTFDIFLFLIMVSIAAVILLPAITGNTQVKSSLESKSQMYSGEMLLTLLNGRVDDFEYTVAGEQMDAVAGPLNKSSIYIAGKKLIAGKELKHKTFADIAAENAATRWVIYNNGTRVELNFLMTNYTDSLNRVMRDYLERQIGDRYSYNFTAVWRPFAGAPIGGDVNIGEQVPENAYSESAYITMPYHTEFTRKHAEGIIDRNFNNSRFGNLSSALEELKNNETYRAEIEDEISSRIFDSINETIDDAVDGVVDETLGPVLDNARNTMVDQVNNLLMKSPVQLNQELNDRINSTLDAAAADIGGTMSDKLKSYFSDVAKQEVHEIAADEIRGFVTDVADLFVNNAITIDEVKDRILTEVFSRININRAQVTLSIWEKRR